MSIKLKVGMTCRNRRGDIVTIAKNGEARRYGKSHPFMGVVVSGEAHGDSYRKDGSFSMNKGVSSEWDIVEVLSDAPKQETFMSTHKKVIQWGEDRDMYIESDAQQQASKALEEFAELVSNVSRIKRGDEVTEEEGEAIKDDIGDIMVCLTHVAKFYGLTLKECYQHAYQEIKDRKGRMVDGKFIKETT